MQLLRAHRNFFAGLLLLLAAAAGGAAWSFLQAGKAEAWKKKALAAEASWATLQRQEIAPTAANVEAARANLDALAAALTEAAGRLEPAQPLELSRDALEVMAGVQGLIQEFRRETERRGIATERNEAFGFARYETSTEPPQPQAIPLLDQQRQILALLLRTLVQAGPSRIVAVEREAVEEGNPNQVPTGPAAGTGARPGNPALDTFALDQAVSARVPGTLETLGFRLVFEGYTESLRAFLNRLGDLGYPLVVRSIEVTAVREAAATEPAATPAAPVSASPFAALFGGAEAASPPPAEEPQQKPIIEDNRSRFSVIVEAVDLVLDVGQILSDPDSENP